MFQLYIQYLPCSFQCIIGDVTDGESLSASHWHDKLNARCVSCRNVAINVACRAVSQQPAAADGHQPFVSHIPTSRSAARIKHQCAETWLPRLSSMNWSKKASRRIRVAVCVLCYQPSHAVQWRWYSHIQMTPHQQLTALKLAMTRIAT